MQPYQSILVAVDFSEHSERALLRGVELAKQTGASIQVLHVMELPTYPILEDIAVLGLPGVWDAEITEQVSTQSKKRLNAMLLQSGLELEQGNLLVGIAKHEILDYSQHIAADLIVIGSHGVHGFSKRLGSTVDNVLHLATCDVLTVRLNNES